MMRLGFVKLLGGAYLLWLPYQHFFLHGDAAARRGPKPAKGWLGLSPFWATVIKVELTDIVFAVDSILVGVAMSSKTWVVLTGGILGIVAMRLVIGKLLTIVRRYPPIVDGAFIIIAWVGAKLLLEWLHLRGWVHFEVPQWLSLGLIVVIFTASYLYARSHGPVVTAEDEAKTADADARSRRPMMREVVARLAARIGDRRRLLYAAVILVAAGIFASQIAALVWVGRYALAVNRLASGVGDVTFFGADGKPWFTLDEHRHDVSLDAISPYLQNAFIATEDRRFYYHPGIDPLGLARALRDNVRQGEAREGASTLTQQLARTLFLTNQRTVGRKLKEAVIAVMLETRLSKSQILELYLNRVYLSAGLYGVETMSTSLFGKHARDLTLAEAALIAGLVKAPSALSPWTNLDGARRRSEHVLDRMQASGYVTAADAASARRQTLPHPAISGRSLCTLRLRERVAAAAVPRRVRRRPAARLGSAHHRPSGAAGHGGAVRGERTVASGHSRPAGGARRARSRHGPCPCDRRRPRFQDVHVQSRLAQSPSAGIGVQALRVCSGARARHDACDGAGRPGGDGAAG